MFYVYVYTHTPILGQFIIQNLLELPLMEYGYSLDAHSLEPPASGPTAAFLIFFKLSWS